MISSKLDLKEYIKRDAVAYLEGNKDTFWLKYGDIRRFYRALRHCEYHHNNHNIIRYFFCRLYYRRIGKRLGWDIPINVLGPGVRIMHPGTVVISGYSKIGEDSKIQVCVNIGASNGQKKAPIIGKHVYIGPGAKIFGDIYIADDIAIGANAVVNKSFTTPGITVAGVPAKIISDKGHCF